MAREKVKWDSSLTIGVDAIDEQHKRFFDIVNEALAGEQAGKLLDELTDYTRFHFKHEADTMEKAKYPDMQKHMLAHEDFIDKLDRMKDDFRNNKLKATEILDFATNWLVLHISNTDRKLGTFLRKL